MAGVTTKSVNVQISLLNAAVTSGFGQMSQQISGLQSQATKLGNQLRLAFAFHEMERFGGAMARTFGGMVQGARDLETALVGVKIATSATDEQVKKLKASLEPVIARHGMTEIAGLEMARQMGKTGLSPSQVAGRFESFASFADIQKQFGMDETASTNLLLKAQGLFSARTDTQAKEVADNLGKALMSTTATPNALLTTLRNLAPSGIMAGMSVSTIMRTAAQLGTIQGARGGTEATRLFMDLMTGSSVEQHRRVGGIDKHAAMRELGIAGMVGKGISDPLELFSKIAKAKEELDPDRFRRDMKVFGAVGERLAGIVDSRFVEQMEEAKARWAKAMTPEEQFVETMKTSNYSMQVFTSNLSILGTHLGQLGAVGIKPVTDALGRWTAQLDAFLGTHTTLGKAAGAAVLGGQGVGLLMEGIGKLGNTFLAFQAIKQALTGKAGIPVYVTNMGGGIPGGGIGGGFLGGLAKKFAPEMGLAGGAAAAVAVGVGVGLYENVKHGDPGGLAHQAAAIEAETQKQKDAKASAEATSGEVSVFTPGARYANPDTVVHVHLDGHIITSKRIRHAANRTSGASTTTLTHSPSSGFGSGGGP
jgi:hypothetical protein